MYFDEPPSLLEISSQNHLSSQILARVPPKLSLTNRNSLLKKIQRFVDLEWPDKNITCILFGSSVNGLGSESSDVDICIQSKILLLNINEIANCLTKAGMENIVTVRAAKVPICKFHDPEL